MSTGCSKIDYNKSECTCVKAECKNHGICCQCVKHHRQLGNYPACLRYDKQAVSD